MNDIIIRELRSDECYVLNSYRDLVVSENETDTKLKDRLTRYISDFGSKKGDYSLVYTIDDKIVGVCTSRLMNNVGINTPTIKIYVDKEYRFRKIGTTLLYKLFFHLLEEGIEKVAVEETITEEKHKLFKNLEFIKKGEYDRISLLISDINKFFCIQILEYDIDVKHSYVASKKQLERDSRYRYTEDEIFKAINKLIEKNVIRDENLTIKMDSPFYGRNDVLIVDNARIKEEILKRRKIRFQEIVDRANELENEEIGSFSYDRLLEERNQIIASKNTGDSYSKKPKTKVKYEDLTEDERNEAIIAEALEGMVYENEVYILIENYMKLYDLTSNDLKERSGISRQVLDNIKKNKTNPSKETMMRLCIGLGLTKDQAILLMQTAGYCFVNTSFIDRIVLTCLERKIHYIREVNGSLIYAQYDDFLFNDHMDFDPRKTKNKEKNKR